MTTDGKPLILSFSQIGKDDVATVGGKNASLGEMIRELADAGVRVPDGFALTADAFRLLLAEGGLEPGLRSALDSYEGDPGRLQQAGAAARGLILGAPLPSRLKDAVGAAYRALAGGDGTMPSVAVRSSATAEDLPEASFAGQLETFLNVSGEEALLQACRRCFASLYTDRAISYRKNKGFGQLDIAVSVGVQRMVRADRGCAGVMFSLDTETGFPDVVLINGAWGLGETVVKGLVDPDEFEIFKPLLDKPGLTPIIRRKRGAKEKKLVYAAGGDEPTILVDTDADERSSDVLETGELLQLARWAVDIERHYRRPMDIEWAKDGVTGELFIVQARPETIHAHGDNSAMRSYTLAGDGRRLVSGAAVGAAIASGQVCRIESPSGMAEFPDGAVLVTGMTDPDWAPIMKRAAAIVTDHGGRTSHAAIVSRELGLPAIVGTGDATQTLDDGQTVTVSCAEGETGFVYEGAIGFETEDVDISAIPATRTRVMLNLANPAAAFRWWRLPADGVGLARIEFIISDEIKVHPLALTRPEAVTDGAVRRAIDRLTADYPEQTEYFIDRLARGVARIAAAHFPAPVIVRLSDFKTNEYAALLGGAFFEPKEENPMLGWRGASRYYHEAYREGFALECAAMRRARTMMGFTNIRLMIPFCRTPEEADNVLGEMERHGLQRGEDGLEILVMAEIPSNVLLADQFAARFDGFSIGSNDLTQLVLGVDRDSEGLRALFDERHEAVKAAIGQLIAAARSGGTPVGICGQAPSDYPDFAQFLVKTGIDSISVSPANFVSVKSAVAAAEAEPGMC